MGIYISTKKVKKGVDFLFIDELSKDHYQNAVFRVHFKYDALKIENAELIEEYLHNSFNNLLEVLNGADNESINSGSHEDRIKALEEELATLTNDINSQTPKHGTLKITPITTNMDFNKDGTMLKFINNDNGVYTTSILQNNVMNDIVLPIGEYTVNIVNSLNDMKDSVFIELWENAVSTDNNHTMKYVVTESESELTAKIEYALNESSIGD